MTRTKLLVSTIFFAISIYTHAQEIEGTYWVEDIKMIVADIGISYSFDQDGTFRKTIHEHLGQKTISGGNYELKGDTLTLHYIRLKPPLPNPFKILKKERLKSLKDTSFNPLFSKIRVFNSKEEPQFGVHLVLQNQEKKPVMAFVSDSTGYFPYLSIYDKYIKELQFSFLAHKEAYLKTDSLFNYRTEIEVKLNDSSLQYINTENTFKYYIKNRNEEKIVLVPESDKDSLILIRAK